ncbi:uncharacterized protein LOC121766938 [Salvia splendens]|uniref:uncharacterized protein LOC121766938 n=1 Tax=Salvia splendens TaxID=180675 RepID=UPI001C255CFD|nr:uncharacterized protein LOC121766938 [Salvia splendens]
MKASKNVTVAFKLNGKNYPLWARLMKVAIGSRGGYSHIRDPPPKPESAEYTEWEETDLVVFSWIIDNIENDKIAYFAHHQTAKAIWDNLAVTFEGKRDSYLIYDLEDKAIALRQGSMDLETYYRRIHGLWINVDRCWKQPVDCCDKGVKQFREFSNTTRLFKFLTGLNPEYDTIRRDILKDEEPYPSVEEAYGRVQREAARLRIMPPASPKTGKDLSVGSTDTSSGEIGYGFRAQRERSSSKGPPRPPPTEVSHQTGGRVDKSKLWCSHCGKNKHTRDTCFLRVGFPDWWDKKQKARAQIKLAAVGINETGQRQGISQIQHRDGSNGGGKQIDNHEYSGDNSDGGGSGVRVGNFVERTGAQTELPKWNSGGDFACETCVLAKSHRQSFKPSDTRMKFMFDLVHADVWGPAPVIGDNGREFVNHTMTDFFQKNSLLHQTSCAYTPEQNRVTERKNRTILEITRAIMIESNVPKTLWPEAVATSVYLINRLPTKVLKMKTPLDILSQQAQIPESLSLSPKVFGCTVYVHIPKHERTKFSPCATKCVFVGYGVNQKGYRCFDPSTKKIITTINCDFLETEFFYNHHLSSQGEKSDSSQNNHGDCLSWFVSPPSHSIEDPPESVDTVAEQAPPESPQPRPSDPPQPVSEVCQNLAPEVDTTESTNHAEMEDNTIDGDTGRYVLPPRANRGVPPKRYSPEKIGKKSRYGVANFAQGNMTKMARAFEAALYEEHEIPHSRRSNEVQTLEIGNAYGNESLDEK